MPSLDRIFYLHVMHRIEIIQKATSMKYITKIAFENEERNNLESKTNSKMHIHTYDDFSKWM